MGSSGGSPRSDPSGPLPVEGDRQQPQQVVGGQAEERVAQAGSGLCQLEERQPGDPPPLQAAQDLSADGQSLRGAGCLRPAEERIVAQR